MLPIAYYLLLVIVLVSLGAAFKKALITAGYSTERKQKFISGYYLITIVFTVLVAMLALNGVYKTTALPPRIALLAVLPVFILITYFFVSKSYKAVIASFPTSFTIYFQSFRIAVELLIYAIVLQNLVPELVSFNGRNYDILAGLSAPVIGMLYNRGIIGKKILLLWNVLCLGLLANIVFIFMTLIAKPQIWGYATTPISMDFLTIPYIYIAAVFMPVAVFLHVMCIYKIRQQSK